ncbi:MAG TPA: sulfite exporter TauE/SafE family protein [Bryobacteraceae bacterium]|jgi:hypothetical protein|nr:sulfite exporter TauE/SafE family protein [Bryobacteraceae bacterium]
MVNSYVTLLVLAGGASIAGLFGSLLGVGGGMFIVPMLVLGFHLPMKSAVAASIVSVIATSNAGGSSYVDQRITNLKLAMFLEVFTTAGAIVGSLLALHAHEWVMLLVFALVLLYLAYANFATRSLDDRKIRNDEFATGTQDAITRFLNLRGVYKDKAANRAVNYVVTGGYAGPAISLLAGITSGMLGVGGGVLKVSAMNRYMNVPMKVAVGTSKLMIGITAAVSAAVFLVAGLIQFALVAPIAIGTTLGATLGTSIMNRLHSSTLKWIFSVLVLYISYSMLAKALGERFGLLLPGIG